MAPAPDDQPTRPRQSDVTRTSSTLGVRRSSASRRDDTSPADGPPRAALEAGRTLGSWQLVRLLGEGGFAEVWEAEEIGSGRRVALKVLTAVRASSDEAVTRFVQEGRLAASLSSPRCVFILGAEAIDGIPAIAMELMPGGSLQDVLRQRGPLPPAEAVQHVLDVIEGLEAAQAAGIVHRDVKPSNCFLDRDGRVRIGDFGISKSLETTNKLTMTGSFLGTPAYASPEQIRGRPIDFRADLYSVGATLHALLTGHAPFESSNAGDLVARIVGDKVPPMSTHGVEIPAALEAAVAKALAKDPAERYDTYDAFRRALLPFRATVTQPAPLVRRAIAYGGDSLLVGMAMIVPMVIAGLRLGMHGNMEAAQLDSLRSSAWLQVTSLAISIAYFAGFEIRHGASPAKRVLGLRVEHVRGGAPGWRRILARTVVFVVTVGLPGVVGAAASRRGLDALPASVIQLAVTVGSMGLLLGPMTLQGRRRGLHEILSGTWTASQAMAAHGAPTLVQRVRAAVAPPLPDVPVGRLGHFALLARQSAGDGWTCWLARDENLGRRAHVLELDAAGPELKEGAERPARLRRLQSSTSDGRRWIALEDPGGASVPALVAADGPMHWGHVRLLLLALYDELAASAKAGDLPPRLCVRQIRLDAGGRMRLSEVPLEPDPDGVDPETPSAEWPAVVHRLFLLCLDGRWPEPGSLQERRPRATLPEHARIHVDAICAAPYGLTMSSLPNASAWLQQDLGSPHELTRQTRLKAMAVPAGLPALVAALTLATLSFSKAFEPISALAFVAKASIDILALMALPSVALAVALRGGVGFRVARIRVQSIDGLAASGLRCGMRALAAWALPLTYAAAIHWLPRFIPGLKAATAPLASSGWLDAALSLLMLAGAILAVRRVERGIPDVVAGTRLVAE